MWGNPSILFAQQRFFHSRGHRTDLDWRAGLVGGIVCEGHRILAGISIFLLEESPQPFDFRKRFFFSCQGVFFLLSLLLEAFQEEGLVEWILN